MMLNERLVYNICSLCFVCMLHCMKLPTWLVLWLSTVAIYNGLCLVDGCFISSHSICTTIYVLIYFLSFFFFQCRSDRSRIHGFFFFPLIEPWRISIWFDRSNGFLIHLSWGPIKRIQIHPSGLLRQFFLRSSPPFIIRWAFLNKHICRKL